MNVSFLYEREEKKSFLERIFFLVYRSDTYLILNSFQKKIRRFYESFSTHGNSSQLKKDISKETETNLIRNFFFKHFTTFLCMLFCYNANVCRVDIGIQNLISLFTGMHVFTFFFLNLNIHRISKFTFLKRYI